MDSPPRAAPCLQWCGHTAGSQPCVQHLGESCHLQQRCTDRRCGPAAAQHTAHSRAVGRPMPPSATQSSSSQAATKASTSMKLLTCSSTRFVSVPYLPRKLAISILFCTRSPVRFASSVASSARFGSWGSLLQKSSSRPVRQPHCCC